MLGGRLASSPRDQTLIQVMKDLSTERGAHVERGEPVQAAEAAKAHGASAEQLFTSRKKRQRIKRKEKYRTKSRKLGIAYDSCLKALGCGGLSAFEIQDLELERGTQPETWPLLSIVSDMGPDCVCLANYLVNKLSLNVDVTYDPCHGAHHACHDGMNRANLRTHSYLMMFAYNIGLGEWKDGTRREQVKQSMADTQQSCGSFHDDVVFRYCMAGLHQEAAASGVSTDDVAELYKWVAANNCWEQADTRLLRG